MMRAALALARRSLGRTWPNPAVGCVIASRDGRIIARGRTRDGGRPHAEVDAIEHAIEPLAGATVYVTFEPCAHHGKSPPCAEALVRAGVARVVSAMADPYPEVDGRGHAMLKAAGIAVEVGEGAAEAAEVNAGFLLRVREGRPLFHLKLAASLEAIGTPRPIDAARTIIDVARGFEIERLTHPGAQLEDLQRRLSLMIDALINDRPAPPRNLPRRRAREANRRRSAP